MNTITKTCPICQRNFGARLSEHNRGNAKVCSRKCASKSSSQKNKILHDPNVNCAYCNAAFYIRPSARSKSKSGLYFCTKEHKNLAQRLYSGFSTLHPQHYSNGSRINYRKHALEHYGPKCQICGYDKFVNVLHVHHIDKNRTNNRLENLQVLCPTCHVEQHMI